MESQNKMKNLAVEISNGIDTRQPYRLSFDYFYISRCFALQFLSHFCRRIKNYVIKHKSKLSVAEKRLMGFLNVREVAKTIRNTELTMKVFYSNY